MKDSTKEKVALLLGFVVRAISSAPSLSVYPPPRGAGVSLSASFTVTVRQNGTAAAMSSTVYSGVSDGRCTEMGEAGTPWCPRGHSQAWTSFFFAGAPVTVTVARQGGWGNWSRVVLRPRSAGVAPDRVNATHLSFELAPSALGYKLSLESAPQITPAPPGPAAAGWPARVSESLMIFADPQAVAPDPGAAACQRPACIYYGAGVHDLGGQLVLPRNVSRVYVAGGAWLNGGFVSAGGGALTISGRGVISGTTFPFLKDPKGMRCEYDGTFCWALINLDGSAQPRLEGVVLHDPPKYYFRTYAASAQLVAVKMLGAWVPNSDGVATGVNGIVADSFIRSSDDSIKLFESGMRVNDVVVWQGTNGAVFQLGWWSDHAQQNIVVQRITVLHAEWKYLGDPWNKQFGTNNAVVNLRGPDGGGTPVPSGGGTYNVSNVSFSDLSVDAPVPGGSLLYFNLSAAIGTVRGLRFDRVRLPSTMPAVVANWSQARDISHWSFLDVTVDGACAADAAAAGFQPPLGRPPPPSTSFACTPKLQSTHR